MDQLRFTTEDLELGTVELLAGINTVGRVEGNSIVIPHTSVSSSHAQINLSAHGVTLIDLGSTNGTFVEGEPVQSRPLRPGQTVQFGTVRAVFESDRPVVADPPVEAVPAAPAPVPAVSVPAVNPPAVTIPSVTVPASPPAAAAPQIRVPAPEIRVPTAPAPAPVINVPKPAVSVPAPAVNVPKPAPAVPAAPAAAAVASPAAPAMAPAPVVPVPEAPKPGGLSVRRSAPHGAPPPAPTAASPAPALAPAATVAPSASGGGGLKVGRSHAPAAAAPAAATAPAPVPGIEQPCKQHPDREAALICKQCLAKLCPECPKEQKATKKVWLLCPLCQGECISLAEYESAQSAKASREGITFFQALPRIFAYPFKQGGWLTLIFATFFYLFVGFLANFSWWMGIIASGYFLAYMQSIVLSSAEGDEKLPGWPEFSSYWDNIIRPLLMFLWTGAVCFGPAIGYLISTAMSEEGELNKMLLLPMIGLGVLYYPMALLCVAMTDSFGGVNPLLVIPTMLKVIGHYLVTCVVFFVVIGALYLLDHLAALAVDQMFDENSIASLLSLGVHMLITGPPTLYFSITLMRLFGMLYYTNRDKLDL